MKPLKNFKIATISASIAIDIATLLKKAGIAPKSLFAKAGINVKATEDPSQMVRLDRFTYLLHLAAESMHRPQLGLETGAQQNPTKWGAFGYVVLNSPTIGIALKNIATFHKASQSGTHIAYVRRGDLFGVEYSILSPRVGYRAQDAEFSMAYVKHIVDQLCEKNVNPAAVHFEHSVLGELAHYKDILGVEPSFEQPVNVILFPKKLLNHPVPSADLQLYPIINQHLTDRLKAIPDDSDIVATVAYHIRQSLPVQQCRLEKIASILAISTRTLQRQLNELGTSFAQVLENTRRELAIGHIENSDIEIKEIGYLVGFGDTSAFIRAFKKWTNKTPAQYRKDKTL